MVGKPDFTNLFWVLKAPENYTGPYTYDALTKAGATVFGYGAFLTAVIQFLLLAFVVFLLVKGMNALREAAEKKKEEAPAAPAPTPEDIALLREIRDLMKNQPKADHPVSRFRIKQFAPQDSRGAFFYWRSSEGAC